MIYIYIYSYSQTHSLYMDILLRSCASVPYKQQQQQNSFLIIVQCKHWWVGGRGAPLRHIGPAALWQEGKGSKGVESRLLHPFRCHILFSSFCLVMLAVCQYHTLFIFRDGGCQSQHSSLDLHPVQCSQVRLRG